MKICAWKMFYIEYSVGFVHGCLNMSSLDALILFVFLNFNPTMKGALPRT
eukprot:TRINITY_DN1732_c0_g1_i2.p1 TRINITY_DN1732_c0_g1~~TRINITY_DN1732_c0_g1_i2.p1  ORF type:complete len:50 (-),score=0.43 TRINITY_DN1732_c0_g1_i2:330-479(-)